MSPTRRRAFFLFTYQINIMQARAACSSFVFGFMTFMSIGGFPSFVEDMKVRSLYDSTLETSTLSYIIDTLPHKSNDLVNQNRFSKGKG